MTENEIIKGCKQGDRKAYKNLVEQYSSQLMGICIRYMRDEPSAKDALQEAYIRIFKSIANITLDGNFIGWMRKITVNECLKMIKKEQSIIDIETVTDVHHSISPSISNILNEEDLLKEINKLPEHYRIIFNLYEIEGYSHKEISQMLDIQESSSRTKLSRAKSILQNLFPTEEKGRFEDKIKSYII